jgi:hypothetical protein
LKDPNHGNVIELLGRNHLIVQLLKGGIHAAAPMWDQGVDLLAYLGGKDHVIARPLQIKAATDTRWGLHKKYTGIQDLLIVYIWNVVNSNEVKIFCMSYKEAEELIIRHKYAESNTWKKPLGHYDIVVGSNSELRKSLEPFLMPPGKWRERLVRP